MKTVKITLIIITLAAIGCIVYFSILNPPEGPKIPPGENQFVNQIDAEIDSLRKSPKTKFCHEFYVNIQHHISAYEKIGHLNNKQDLLVKKLYSTYSEKFIDQVFYIFSGSGWEKTDLNFISTETTELQKSPFLGKGSVVYKKFNEIRIIINKYNEINSFIASANYSGQNVSDISSIFPIENVKGKVANANRYESNKLENEYVNNCIRLHDELRKIPRKMYRNHLDYLKNKVSYWSDKYKNYSSHEDYWNNLGTIIDREIDSVESNISNYGLSTPDQEWDKIKKDWEADSYNAYMYFKNKTNNKTN